MRILASLPLVFSITFLALLGRSAAAQSPPPTPVPDEVERIRAELRELQERMAALETRLDALHPAAPSAVAAPTQPEPSQPPPPSPPSTGAVPTGAAGAGGPTGNLPVYGGGAAASKVFNPDIAVIGDFLGTVGKSPGSGEPSLEMHESELAFQAVVDPYARADFFLTFGPDSVGVEEAFITFPTAPGGLLLKVGKMRDAFGKVNGMHNHVLPWADRPLVTKNLAGGEDGLDDAGISIARLIPNPWVFLEATGQVFRGNSDVFKATSRGELAYVGHLRAYQDLSESTNLDLGGSVAWGNNEVGPGFKTRLLGADATFRYRPLRRAIYHQLIARSEVVWSRKQQLGEEVNAFGTFFSLDYQFARRWFTGGRLDYSERADNARLADKGGSFLLTYWPSEFSQLRSQYRYTRFGEGRTANEILVQFLFSIGAHGAHPF